MLNLDFLGGFGQFIPELAQTLLQIRQGLAAKAVQTEQGLLAFFQGGEHIARGGNPGFDENIRSALAEAKIGNRAFRGDTGSRFASCWARNSWRACNFL